METFKLYNLSFFINPEKGAIKKGEKKYFLFLKKEKFKTGKKTVWEKKKNIIEFSFYGTIKGEWIVNKNEIYVFYNSDFSKEQIFNAINPLLSLVLIKKGVVLIHASAVKFKNKIFLFSGRTGAGKSTAASAFKQILSDDKVFLDLKKGFFIFENKRKAKKVSFIFLKKGCEFQIKGIQKEKGLELFYSNSGFCILKDKVNFFKTEFAGAFKRSVSFVLPLSFYVLTAKKTSLKKALELYKKMVVNI